MKFHILTIFPDFFDGPFRHGVVPRAVESGIVQIHVYDLRDWTTDRHRTVDDRPFGGGEGMLLKPEPIFKAVESIWPERTPQRRVVLLVRFRQAFRSGRRPPFERLRRTAADLRPLRRRG